MILLCDDLFFLYIFFFFQEPKNLLLNNTRKHQNNLLSIIKSITKYNRRDVCDEYLCFSLMSVEFLKRIFMPLYYILCCVYNIVFGKLLKLFPSGI